MRTARLRIAARKLLRHLRSFEWLCALPFDGRTGQQGGSQSQFVSYIPHPIGGELSASPIFIPCMSSTHGEHLDASTPLPAAQWTVRVRTMLGRELVVTCPQGALTTVGDVKRDLKRQHRAWAVEAQRLMLPPALKEEDHESSSGSMQASENHHFEPLADECTLHACGLGDRGALELLVLNPEWGERDQALVNEVETGGVSINMSGRRLDEQAAKPIAWALLNEVRMSNRVPFFTRPEIIFFSCFVCFLSFCAQINPLVESLDLGGNALGDEGTVLICDALYAAHSRLVRLDLASNKVRMRGATAVTEALRDDACRLHHLDMSDNLLGTSSASAVCAAIRWNSSLRQLMIGGNGLGATGLVVLSEALCANQTLVHLDMANSRLSNASIAHLGKALCVNATLQRLDMIANGIGPVGALHLCQALRANTTLVHLDLEYNQIGFEGAAAVCAALHANVTLTHLNLGSNGICSEGAESVAAMLRANPRGLRHLNLGGNWIGDAGAEAISDALMSPHVALQHLELGANDIELRGATALSRALRANSALLHLDLRGNLIQDEGAALLCEALSGADGNASLQQLVLAENGIGNGTNGDAVWLPAVCGMLRSNAALLHVDLTLNGLGAAGVAAVCTALCNEASTSPLQHLGLGSNDGGDDGAIAAADMLRAHTSLLYLGISNSDIGETGLAALAEAIGCNSSLQELDVSANRVHAPRATALLSEAIKKRGLPLKVPSR